MDNAVALVQAYLNVNGYFTVTEYPVLEALKHGRYKAATDIDILAYRFPGAGLLVSRKGKSEGGRTDLFAPDPELGIPGDHADMLIGEVKEGQARFNQATRDLEVLSVALARFGCCSHQEIASVVAELFRNGFAKTPCGHSIRMVAFGSTLGEQEEKVCMTISLGHIVRFLQNYLRQHWEVLHHAQFKDPAFGFLVILEKALRNVDH
jgi:hypothetical protein